MIVVFPMFFFVSLLDRLTYWFLLSLPLLRNPQLTKERGKESLKFLKIWPETKLFGHP